MKTKTEKLERVLALPTAFGCVYGQGTEDKPHGSSHTDHIYQCVYGSPCVPHICYKIVTSLYCNSSSDPSQDSAAQVTQGSKVKGQRKR